MLRIEGAGIIRDRTQRRLEVFSGFSDLDLATCRGDLNHGALERGHRRPGEFTLHCITSDFAHGELKVREGLGVDESLVRTNSWISSLPRTILTASATTWATWSSSNLLTSICWLIILLGLGLNITDTKMVGPGKGVTKSRAVASVGRLLAETFEAFGVV